MRLPLFERWSGFLSQTTRPQSRLPPGLPPGLPHGAISTAPWPVWSIHTPATSAEGACPAPPPASTTAAATTLPARRKNRAIPVRYIAKRSPGLNLAPVRWLDATSIGRKCGSVGIAVKSWPARADLSLTLGPTFSWPHAGPYITNATPAAGAPAHIQPRSLTAPRAAPQRAVVATASTRRPDDVNPGVPQPVPRPRP